MAQENVSNPLHDTKAITWSPLPSVLYTESRSTKSEATSSFKMVKQQLAGWNNFEAEVRESSIASLGPQTQIIPTQTEREIIHVGNENGLMGRFGQNIGHVMSEVFRNCNLPINFADYQVGQSTVEHNNVPDWILMDDQYEIRAAGEGKTFWTKPRLAEPDPEPLATWLGQLARYMDDLKVRYGFYTSYQVTRFLRRSSDTTFEVSPPIFDSTVSSEKGGKNGVSVRECFLHLAKLVNSDSYKYPITYGVDLTNGSLLPQERRSQRIESMMAKMNLKER
ncbi:MAG: hypothetical protein M1840_002663 [Geoglossum simile]|nr:MAG: hypothetical protein M1840_002663 [Geoglossum simile]